MSEARYRQERYSEMIEKLEEDLEFLKAEATLATYTISNNIEDYPDYILDAARTVVQKWIYAHRQKCSLTRLTA